MIKIEYIYSLSNFVVFDKYEKERFNEVKTDDSLDEQLHKQILKNINNYLYKKTNILDNRLKKISVSKKIINEYLENSGDTHIYNPLRDTPELFLELNKLEIFNEKQLDKFIKIYGIPYHEYIDAKGKSIFKSNLFKKNANETALRTMDVLMFYEKLLEYKKVISIWVNITQGNFECLKAIKEEFKFYAHYNENHRNVFMKELSAEEYLSYICSTLGIIEDEERELITDIFLKKPEQISLLQEKASYEISTWRTVQNRSDKDVALAYLNLQLNKLESGIFTTTYTDGKIVPAVSFQNLLEVAAFQLKNAIINNVEFKICLNCGALFAPRHASQKFCSPLPGRKRSTCENTYNQRKKRLKNKEGLERS